MQKHVRDSPQNMTEGNFPKFSLLKKKTKNKEKVHRHTSAVQEVNILADYTA